MRTIFIYFNLIALLGCSSVRRQRTLGAVIGAMAIGGLVGSIGEELSPNPESEKLNRNLGMAAGGVLGLYLGSKTAEYLWEDIPSHKEQTTMLHEEKAKNKRHKVRVLRPKNLKRIKLEPKLPAFLKGKVKEANIITYELEAYEEETEDGRVIFHEPHKAYEYILESL